MRHINYFGVILTIVPVMFAMALWDKPNDTDARVVLDWNELIINTAAEVDRFQTLRSNRAVPMVQLAVHDALNAIVPVYEQYAYTGSNEGAHPVAAASQAAHDVMTELFPNHSETASDLHRQWLGEIPDGPAKEQGIVTGKLAAEAILQKRENDGYDSEGEFTPRDEPGSYQITPPFDEPIGTGWPDTEPMSMIAPDQFRPGPPPAVDSEQYASDFEEVKRLGKKGSEQRTDDETRIGYWFAEYPTVAYPDFSRTYVAEHEIHPWSAARLFALLAIDNFDGLISVFDAKYEYAFWRPYTAIRNADQDGNPRTEPDPDWEPEMTTAPHPDYPAALSTLCAGGAEVMKDVIGTPNFNYARRSGNMPEGLPAKRSYESIDDAVTDCLDSRIYNGYHFRTGLEVGDEMGRERARHLLRNYLTRRSGTDYPDLAAF